MDERPIDPFSPQGGQPAPPPQWPPAPVESDTREVPVVSAGAPPPWPPIDPAPPQSPPPPPVPEPALPARRRSLGTPIAVGAGIFVLLAIVATAIFVMRPGTVDDTDKAASSDEATKESDGSSSSSASPSHSSSASKKPKPDGGASDTPGSSESEDPKPETEDKLTVPSRPAKFGAWSAGYGTYEAKWQAPDDDGGSGIITYVIGDCQGNNLTVVDSRTFTVTVQHDKLDCMSVYAVNSQGQGADAQHTIDNNP